MNTYVTYVLFCVGVSVFAENGNHGNSTCLTPQNKIADCVIIHNCPWMLKLLEQKPLTEGNIRLLKNSQCGFEGTKPKVCCSQEPYSIETSGEDNMVTNLLPDTNICGIDTSRRIPIGGDKTDIDEFPWMALIKYNTPSGSRFHCGGSLINKRYVLTAGHCVSRISKNWTLTGVRLGEHDLDQEIDCTSDILEFQDCADKPIDVGVEETIVYKDYNPTTNTQYHDIALLRLDRDVTFTDFVRPICLPISKEIQEKNLTGTTLIVSGWGKTESTTQSNIKLKVKVAVKSESDCVSLYSESANVTLINNQICAGGEKGTDSCTGDSGGPLMTLHYIPGVDVSWYAAGIVSFGPTPCGLRNFPAVYTKVAPYMSWIISNLKP